MSVRDAHESSKFIDTVQLSDGLLNWRLPLYIAVILHGVAAIFMVYWNYADTQHSNSRAKGRL
jgi:hypothetical protein